MCLQDYQLARAELVERYTINYSGSLTQRLLPPNPQRTRFLILGPSGGNLTLRLGGTANDFHLITLSSNFGTLGKSFAIYDIGSEITGELFGNSSQACTVTVIDYSLPVDPESLKRLAATGKW